MWTFREWLISLGSAWATLLIASLRRRDWSGAIAAYVLLLAVAITYAATQ